MSLAFIFPGQGSQSQGMLSELSVLHPSIIDSFSEVSDTLAFDVWKLAQEGSELELNQTTNTQVLMLTADIAIFRLLQKLQISKGQWMAGHSLGEYAALVAANAISLSDAAILVQKRAQLMQETVPLGKGGMAAIVGMTDDEVTAICAEASTLTEQVTPANFNAIGQVVIAGHMPALLHAIELAEIKGARLAKIIPVSVPCHCPLLSDAASAFEEYLAIAPFKTPEVSVISNVDLSVYGAPSHIRTLLKEQLVKPVRWVETIQMMKSKGVTTLFESGPGKVLCGLVRRIDKSLVVMSAQDRASLEQSLKELQ